MQQCARRKTTKRLLRQGKDTPRRQYEHITSQLVGPLYTCSGASRRPRSQIIPGVAKTVIITSPIPLHLSARTLTQFGFCFGPRNVALHFDRISGHAGEVLNSGRARACMARMWAMTRERIEGESRWTHQLKAAVRAGKSDALFAVRGATLRCPPRS